MSKWTYHMKRAPLSLAVFVALYWLFEDRLLSAAELSVAVVAYACTLALLCSAEAWLKRWWGERRGGER